MLEKFLNVGDVPSGRRPGKRGAAGRVDGVNLLDIEVEKLGLELAWFDAED
jgi:hypothetical protein